MADKHKKNGQEPEDPTGVPVDSGAPASDSGAEPAFVSMEGPDVETPIGDSSGPESEFSADDLSFLENLSAGIAPEPDPEPENEHLIDLKRVTAEYANYRRRTEANREIERNRAVGDVVKQLLPVLDDLDRAEKHGDLAEGGPLTTIAQKLRTTVEKIGLIAYGEVGETFDPAHHEAIFQKSNPEVDAPTIADVVERGYRVGDVTLRAAKVVVDTPGA